MTKMTSRTHSSPADNRHVVQYDHHSTESLSVAIADAVATHCDQEVTTLEPLHYAINAEALERLFEPRANELRTGGSITFEYNECLVTVTARGEITIEST
jgi:hypothetical protein